MLFRSVYVGILAIGCTIAGQSTESTSNGYYKSQDSEHTLPLFSPGVMPDPGDVPLLNRQIFQGYRVTIEEHPYIVSIRRNFAHYLVGTMLSRTLVVTVAHPLDQVPISELAVVAGEHYADRGSMLLTVILVVVHRRFNPYTLFNNIALLQLYEDPGYTYKVKPILGIWGESFKYTGKTGFVTGWGRCDLTGSELCLPRSSEYYQNEYLDPMLKTVKIVLNENSTDCDAYSTMAVPLTSHDQWMCAGEARRHQPTAPCMGVPGAPLVVEGRLLGLSSWGFGCGYSDDLPLVYTDIRAYNEWLNTNMRASMSALTPAIKLNGIFEATRSYKLLQWVHRSRGHSKLSWQVSLNMELLPLPDDQNVLAKYDGLVYDVRDYLADGEYTENKQDMMKMVQSVMARTINPEETRSRSTASTWVYKEYMGLDMAPAHSSNTTADSYGWHTTEVASDDYSEDYRDQHGADLSEPTYE